PPSETGDLSAEIRALEQVRAAIAERRIADARSKIASYKRAFPRRLLGQEVGVLEIEVLVAEGRRDEAEALAHTFLRSAERSPYPARVRSLVAGSRLP